VLDAIRTFFDAYLRGRWTSLIDILLVAVVIYWVFILIRGTRAVRIVIGLSILYLVYLGAQLADLRLLSTLLQTGAVVGLFAIVVVFQPELRRALEQIGRMGSFNRFFVSSDVTAAERVAREVSRAARLLAGSRHGALIVLERETGLADLAESGVQINADLRAELLATIFYHGTALHDGAVIISGERILAAAVLLPLSQNVLDSERYGTRHRAAIGISEQSDAIIVVVSEETGSISLVMRGRIERNLTEEQLRRRVLNLIRPQAPRRTAALLRRSTEGRWGVDAVGEPEQPIDPEARVVSPEPDLAVQSEVIAADDPTRPVATAGSIKAVKPAKPAEQVRPQAAAPGQRRR